MSFVGHLGHDFKMLVRCNNPICSATLISLDIHITDRYMGALLPRPQFNWLHYCALHIAGASSVCETGGLYKMKHLY